MFQGRGTSSKEFKVFGRFKIIKIPFVDIDLKGLLAEAFCLFLRFQSKDWSCIFYCPFQGCGPNNDILSIIDGFISKYMNFQVVWIKNSNLISFLKLY